MKRASKEISMTTIPPHKALIARLEQRIHDALAPHVDPETPLAIVDFPDIRNCGDSAIWMGEIAWLKRRFGKKPSYVCRGHDLDAQLLRETVPDGPIFIHGGGNFGDIWEGKQDVKEHVIQSFPDHKIVQCPQSIHYDSMERADETARVIEKHGNVFLYLRDQESYDFAKSKFQCEVHLCPDMAFCIGPMADRPAPLPVLAMLREDREKARTDDWNWPDIPREDWITEQKYKVKLAKLKGAIRAGFASYPQRRFHILDAAAEQRFERGIRQISRAKAIVTDRLHVHICSTLLGRPHAVLDNSYGKIARHMNTFYPEGTGLTHRPETLAEAIDWAQTAAQKKS